MMRWLQNLSIKYKLTLIIMCTSGAALLLAGAGFATYEHAAFKRTMVGNLATTAEMIGFNSASALFFDDASSAEQTLRSLAAQPHVIVACVYDREGKVFATYQNDHTGRLPVGIEPAPAAAFVRFGSDRLDLFRPIIFNGEGIGMIHLRSDLHEWKERQRDYALIGGGVILVALLAAYFLAARLRRLIATPVMALAAIASRVAREKNYALRAVKHGGDEVGRLIDDFNGMLAQIQTQDDALRATRTHLEQRVQNRTAALELAQARALQEQARFKLIFDSVPVGISYFQEQSEGELAVSLINGAHLRICGLDEVQARDHGVFKRITHPEDQERQRILEAKVIAGEIDRFALEKRYLRPDGQTVWVAFSTQCKHNADGSIEHLSTLVDITDLKRAQEETASERERFKFIFDAVPVGISYITGRPDTGPLACLINEAHLVICGLTREEACDLNRFKEISHPEDLERQMVFERRLERGEIDRFSIEKRYLRPDGRIVWVTFSVMRKEFPNGTVDRLTTVVDISALKQAQEMAGRQEAQLRFIFEAIPYSVAWVRYHDTGNESMLNTAFYRITGLSREKAAEIGMIRSLTHPEDLQRQDALRVKIDRGEIDDFTMEKRYLRPDGTIVWVLLTIAVYRGPDRRIQQEVSTLVDITARKQAEAEMEKLHRQLLTTSRQAGMAEVATGVLHNVGNVLNSVNVSATLVTEQVRHSKISNLGKVSALFEQHAADLGAYLTADPKGRMIPAYLATLAESLSTEQQTMLTELDSLHKNIEHIKDIVAMQQSYAKTSGVTETVSVPDLVEDALRMNAGSLARHDIDLVRDYQARPVVTLDKHKVLQILVNLVRNAKYACDESGRTDKLITLRITADDRYVSITVCDNGVGIVAENLTRIFAHGFTTREQGHGFGLHSGALAANELGGSLVARSAGPGQGAAFILKLPYTKEIPAHAEPTV